MKIAIIPDHLRHKNGEEQSFSARWMDLAEKRGVETVPVRLNDANFFERLNGCNGFMWRFGYDPLSLIRAKRILLAVEQGMGIAVFPSWRSHWHFEDKIAQAYLLEAAGIPTPRTWVFWTEEAASAFCESAQYPLVGKLSRGIQSENVRLLRSPEDARDLIRGMFRTGLRSLIEPQGLQGLLRHRVPGLKLLLGRPMPRGIEHGYVYLQEFLPDNTFDTRVTVIGNRAFAFRRHNRPNDFRASGSGRIDWAVDEIDEATVRLAFQVARTLKTQSVAIDGLRRGAERVVGEISYTYASWAVRDCPGHWALDGDPANGTLTWIEGRLHPEDAIFEDFVAMLHKNEGRERSLPKPSAPLP